MNDKRFLFRGFHPDENGKTTITLPKVSEQEIAEVERKIKVALDEFNITYAAKLNDELQSLKAERNVKVKGEWVYWDKYGTLTEWIKVNDAVKTKHVFDLIIIDETVAQWVTTDNNGNDVFYGDRVRDYDNGNTGTLLYSGVSYKFYIDSDEWGEMIEIDDWNIELIGNKWEVKE